MESRITQEELKRHREILLATSDYLLDKTAQRVKWDQFDPTGDQYRKIKEKTEKYYQAGALGKLQKLLLEATELPRHTGDKDFEKYIQEKTGYIVNVVEMKDNISGKSKGKTTDNSFRIFRQLSEIYSPDKKRKILITESGAGAGDVVTQVTIQFPQAGASIYGVNGGDLGIRASWKDNNTVIIETKKEYRSLTREFRQVQSQDDVVTIQIIEV